MKNMKKEYMTASKKVYSLIVDFRRFFLSLNYPHGGQDVFTLEKTVDSWCVDRKVPEICVSFFLDYARALANDLFYVDCILWGVKKAKKEGLPVYTGGYLDTYRDYGLSGADRS